jgi:hypothetical protein
MTHENFEKANSIMQKLMQFKRDRDTVAGMRGLEITSDRYLDTFSSVTFGDTNDISMVLSVKELVLARLDSKIAYWIDQLELL